MENGSSCKCDACGATIVIQMQSEVLPRGVTRHFFQCSCGVQYTSFFEDKAVRALRQSIKAKWSLFHKAGRDVQKRERIMKDIEDAQVRMKKLLADLRKAHAS
ncbi:hypothetical protein D3C85_1536120 [compost metagenome]